MNAVDTACWKSGVQHDANTRLCNRALLIDLESAHSVMAFDVNTGHSARTNLQDSHSLLQIILINGIHEKAIVGASPHSLTVEILGSNYPY